MAKLEFTEQDFISFNEVFIGGDTLSALQMRASRIANARLKQMLEEAPIVYADNQVSLWSEENEVETYIVYTHTAKLVNIELIKEKE